MRSGGGGLSRLRRFKLLGRSREVDVGDGMHGTLGDTLTAGFALGVIDIGHIVAHRNSFKGAYLGALAAADTCVLAGLHSHSAFFLVDTADEDTTALIALVSQLDNTARTSFGTGATGGALLLVDHRRAGLGIHMDGIKLAGSHTVATS